MACYSRPTVYAYVPKIVTIGLFCRPLALNNPNFLPTFGLRHLVMSTVGGNLRKLNTGAQLQTFPYATASNRFCTPTPSWRNRAHKLYVQKRDGQTNKQANREKNSSFWSPRRRVKSELHQTWHGDSGPRARSCTSETFAGLMHSFAARGR